MKKESPPTSTKESYVHIPFGRRLKDLRKGRFTQRGLAFKSGVNNSVISRIEAGKRNPDLETAVKLARALTPDPFERILLYESTVDSEKSRHDNLEEKKTKEQEEPYFPPIIPKNS